jgi:four helix bundle protein
VLKSYRELKVWDKAYALSLSVYRLTRDLPATELYGLVTQMRRAAVSIPSNIAEGCGRGSTQEYIRSLRSASARTANSKPR